MYIEIHLNLFSHHIDEYQIPLHISRCRTTNFNKYLLKSYRIRSSDNDERQTNKRCKYDERINAVDCTTKRDADKVVDCTVAAIEQSIIRNKLNRNDDETSDNELDDEDDEGRSDAACIFVIDFDFSLHILVMFELKKKCKNKRK